MSLITRCPACGTMFKVVPDQLRISEGWVRCGHCSEIFDASANMQQEAPPVAEVERAVEPVPEHVVEENDTHAGIDASNGFGSSIHTGIGHGPNDRFADELTDSEMLEAEAHALREHPLDQPFELRRADMPAVEQAEAPSPYLPPEPEPEVHDLSFVKQARRQAFWRRPGVRFVMALSFILLAVALTLQVAFHDRDKLAASDPGFRPWLQGMCSVFNCRLGAPKQIESIAIDNSTFNKLRGDAYRLNVTLRNQAGVEVALPALELTLTDGQDQAVIRRVLLPEEIAPNTPVIKAGSDWTTSIAIAVNAGGNGGVAARVAGYRLLAFYP